jgi:hypothetical protein
LSATNYVTLFGCSFGSKNTERTQCVRCSARLVDAERRTRAMENRKAPAKKCTIQDIEARFDLERLDAQLRVAVAALERLRHGGEAFVAASEALEEIKLLENTAHLARTTPEVRT